MFWFGFGFFFIFYFFASRFQISLHPHRYFQKRRYSKYLLYGLNIERGLQSMCIQSGELGDAPLHIAPTLIPKEIWYHTVQTLKLFHNKVFFLLHKISLGFGFFFFITHVFLYFHTSNLKLKMNKINCIEHLTKRSNSQAVTEKNLPGIMLYGKPSPSVTKITSITSTCKITPPLSCYH